MKMIVAMIQMNQMMIKVKKKKLKISLRLMIKKRQLLRKNKLLNKRIQLIKSS